MYNEIIQKKCVTIFTIIRRGFFYLVEDFSMLKLVTKRCKGCGICVNFCPKKVLEVTEVGKCAIIKDKEKDCIKCGQCEMRCPDYAIFVEK